MSATRTRHPFCTNYGGHSPHSFPFETLSGKVTVQCEGTYAPLASTTDRGREDVATVYASPMAEVLGHCGRSLAVVIDYSLIWDVLAALESRASSVMNQDALDLVAAKIRTDLDL